MNSRLDLEELEEFFAAKGRTRILGVIAEYGEVNISQLARRVGMNHTSVVRHVKRLKKAGLVNDKRYGTLRVLEFRPDTLTVTLRKGHTSEVELRGGEQ